MAWPSTFLNLQTNVIARLNLDATADLSMVKDAINQAYGQVCIETEAVVVAETKTLTAGTATYDVSTFATGKVVRIKSMYATFGGVTMRPMEQLTLDALLSRRVATGGASTATGTATHYALNGQNDLELWPTPLSADVLTIFAVEQPTALSADADVPVIPEPYATRCLTYGACSELADLTGDPAGDEYQASFESWLARFRAHLGRRRGGQPGQFEFVPDRAFPPHDRSSLASGWGV